MIVEAGPKKGWSYSGGTQFTRRRVLACLCVLALSFTVRGVTVQFLRPRLVDLGWFQAGTYAIFDAQARAILDGSSSVFWIDDPSRTQAAVYPPGYAIWLALIYKLSGIRSAYVVQDVQWVLDALAVSLVIGIGVTAFGWRVGSMAGALAALSPMLALYGVTPMADAATSWVVLGGVWIFVLAFKRRDWRWALGAGLLIGASCWLRANALLLVIMWAMALLILLRGVWREKLILSGALVLGMLLLVAPITVRNAVAFRALLPTGLGVGTNLWEGIGETKRAAEFGAVYGDANVIEQERAAMNLAPDAPLRLYYPDGVRRDRERALRALSIIQAHPVWYAGVMLRRIWGVLDYTGETSFYGRAGINVTSGKLLPLNWQGGVVALLVNLLGTAVSVWQHVALPMIVGGTLLALLYDWRMAGLLLATVLYYLVVGSFMHTEIRYGLPMQALLLVFSAFSIVRVIDIVHGVRQRRRAHRQPQNGMGAQQA